MLGNLTAADFDPRVGQAFRIVPEGGAPVEAMLAEVIEHGGGAPEQRAPFSLFFHAPAGAAALQGTFQVEHDELETMDLFMVPVGEPAGGGLIYQAVFG